jgi:hypothetical protein
MGMLQNISFSAYLKRTVCFYCVIFFATKYCIDYIIKVKESSNNKIDMIIPPEEIKIGDDNNEVEDEFIPLNLENNKITTDMNKS